VVVIDRYEVRGKNVVFLSWDYLPQFQFHVILRGKLQQATKHVERKNSDIKRTWKEFNRPPAMMFSSSPTWREKKKER